MNKNTQNRTKDLDNGQQHTITAKTRIRTHQQPSRLGQQLNKTTQKWITIKYTDSNSPNTPKTLKHPSKLKSTTKQIELTQCLGLDVALAMYIGWWSSFCGNSHEDEWFNNLGDHLFTLTGSLWYRNMDTQVCLHACWNKQTARDLQLPCCCLYKPTGPQRTCPPTFIVTSRSEYCCLAEVVNTPETNVHSECLRYVLVTNWLKM